MKASIHICCVAILLSALPARAQFTCTTNADNSVSITGYSGPGGNLIIPTNIDGHTVSDIAWQAFSGNNTITNLTIPGTITNLDNEAFQGCANLASVIINYGVATLGAHVYSDAGPFFNCPSLTNVIIPSSVTTIGFDAFLNCSKLASVTIPPSVTQLGQSAFEGCALTNVVVPASLTNLGDYAFMDNPLTNAFFLGNSPVGGYSAMSFNTTVYYLPFKTGWSNTFSTTPAVPSVLWNPLMTPHNPVHNIHTNIPFGFDVTGTSNIPVVIEVNTNLARSAWATLTNIHLTNGLYHFSDTNWTNFPARYYRISGF